MIAQPLTPTGPAGALTETPCVYRILINDQLAYIGRTLFSHTRFINYRRKAGQLFLGVRPPSGGQYRRIHRAIADAWERGHAVVFEVYLHPEVSFSQLADLESLLIAANLPPYNGPMQRIAG